MIKAGYYGTLDCPIPEDPRVPYGISPWQYYNPENMNRNAQGFRIPYGNCDVNVREKAVSKKQQQLNNG